MATTAVQPPLPPPPPADAAVPVVVSSPSLDSASVSASTPRSETSSLAFVTPAQSPAPVDAVEAAPSPTTASKLPNFLFWRDGSSRFLSRARSQSAQRPPLASTPVYPTPGTLQPSQSFPNLKDSMAVVNGTPSSPTPMPTPPTKLIPPESELLNTIPDPRSPSTASTSSRTDSVVDANPHNPPELNEEIAKISQKLVNAINHQTTLDDNLQETRHELEIAKRQIAQYEQKVKDGSLVSFEDVVKKESKFNLDLATERELRQKAEKDKKSMEQELETLTAQLFTEANEMVASARKETEKQEKKAEQLKNQLRDNEVLLQSQQEQLSDLKGVLEKIHSDRGDDDSVTHSSSNAPSSPAVTSNDKMAKLFENAHSNSTDPAISEISADHPLHFSHLIQPVFRTDVTAFDDFSSLIKQARAASPPPSRVVSGSFSSLNIVGGSQASSSPVTTSPAIGQFPLAIVNSASTSPRISATSQAIAIKDTKVYKRAVVEDIDPTLRLDIAPGVSWMVRRQILSSMVDGHLVIEPMPPSPVKYRGPVNQCSLCGENRIGELYTRKHRFRISEDSEARRYPLCDLCLGRLRSVGDLLSFLRMVTNGHWRADTDEEIKSAWEEFVRLREKMFWHRISAKVVPVTTATREAYVQSPRDSIAIESTQATTDLDTTIEQKDGTQTEADSKLEAVESVPETSTEVKAEAEQTTTEESLKESVVEAKSPEPTAKKDDAANTTVDEVSPPIPGGFN